MAIQEIIIRLPVMITVIPITAVGQQRIRLVVVITRVKITTVIIEMRLTTIVIIGMSLIIILEITATAPLIIRTQLDLVALLPLQLQGQLIIERVTIIAIIIQIMLTVIREVAALAVV
ncbi:hypothetical protein HMPREF9104_02754 [Lentilactobacillus kisonensis F0435]|uniref:Uncharacterized protein n=1 Tax=Lentilactobacillus kisonensis F0435 TaxID=797516 RepID=H1LJG2_9LACO|nr:hypothetical protein HMPREF9104_02754 [Lentilactobacillus kisonensis F0435]